MKVRIEIGRGSISKGWWFIVCNADTQSFVLNFSGRVTQASVKNFQIVHDNDCKCYQHIEHWSKWLISISGLYCDAVWKNGPWPLYHGFQVPHVSCTSICHSSYFIWRQTCMWIMKLLYHQHMTINVLFMQHMDLSLCVASIAVYIITICMYTCMMAPDIIPQGLYSTHDDRSWHESGDNTSLC